MRFLTISFAVFLVSLHAASADVKFNLVSSGPHEGSVHCISARMNVVGAFWSAGANPPPIPEGFGGAALPAPVWSFEYAGGVQWPLLRIYPFYAYGNRKYFPGVSKLESEPK